MLNCELRISDEKGALFGSLINFGCLFGALFGGKFTDVLGKRLGMTVAVRMLPLACTKLSNGAALLAPTPLKEDRSGLSAVAQHRISPKKLHGNQTLQVLLVFLCAGLLTRRRPTSCTAGSCATVNGSEFYVYRGVRPARLGKRTGSRRPF